MSPDNPRINGCRRASDDTNTTATDDIMSRSTADNPYSSWLEPSASTDNGTHLEQWIGDNVQDPDLSARRPRAGQFPNSFYPPMTNGTHAPVNPAVHPSLNGMGPRWTGHGATYQTTDLKYVGSSFAEEVPRGQGYASLSFTHTDEPRSGMSLQDYVPAGTSATTDASSAFTSTSAPSGEPSYHTHVYGTDHDYTSSPGRHGVTSQDVPRSDTRQNFAHGNESSQFSGNPAYDNTMDCTFGSYPHNGHDSDQMDQDVVMSDLSNRHQGESRTW